MKLINTEIKVQIFNKNKKLKKEFIKKNRILDNYLNFAIYRLFGDNLNTSVFPSYFDNMQDTSVAQSLNACYVKFDSGISFTDATNTMSYDLKIFNQFASLKETENDINIQENEISITYRHKTTISSSDDGKQIFTIGFGQNDSDVTKFLFAAVDVEINDFFVFEDDILIITRNDKYTTNGIFKEITSGIDYQIHLNKVLRPYLVDGEPTTNPYAKLYSIGFSKTDGSIIGKEYFVDHLTVMVTAEPLPPVSYIPGSATITGFDNFTDFNDFNLHGYPNQTLFGYPRNNIYPQGIQYKNVIMKYQIQEKTGVDFTESSYTSVQKFYEVIVPLQELDISFSGNEMRMQITHERGDL